WITHCAGAYDREVVSGDAPRPDTEGEPLEAATDAGFTIGPSFRWIRGASRVGTDVVCRLQAPGAIEPLRLHPGLIDSCLRTLSLPLDSAEVGAPFHVGALRLFRVPKPGGPMWCQVTASGDIRLFDGDALAMEIEGLEVRKLDRPSVLPLVRVEWRE